MTYGYSLHDIRLQCVGGALFQLANKNLTSRYPSITVAAYGYAVGGK